MNTITKRIISLASASVITLGMLAGCSSSTTNTQESESTVSTKDLQKACDSVLTYRYNYDLSSYVSVPEYKGLAADSYEVTVTDDEVADNIYAVRSYYAKSTSTNAPAKEFDTVKLSYTASSDGAELVSEKDVDIYVGAGSMPEEFESSLIGKSAGDSYSITITFPTPYEPSPVYSGVTATFDISISDVCTKELPLWSDDFVRAYLGYNSVAEYTDYVRSYLENYFTSARDEYVISQLRTTLLDSCEVINYPENEYYDMYNAIVKAHNASAEKTGISFESYCSINYNMTPEEFYEYTADMCHEQIKVEIVLYYIARNEGITLTPDEYYDRIGEYVKDYELSSVAEFESQFSTEAICQTFMFDKVFEFIYDNASLNIAK